MKAVVDKVQPDIGALCRLVATDKAERAQCFSFWSASGPSLKDAFSTLSVCTRMGHCGDRFERYMARKPDRKWVKGSFPFHYYGDAGEGSTTAARYARIR